MRLDHSSASSVLILAIFAFSRGSAYSFTAVALAALSTGNVTFLRLGIGALALLAWSAFTVRGIAWVQQDWKAILAFAIVGNSLPNWLITLGQETVPSGLASVMMALTPMFSAIIAHVWLQNEKLTSRAVIGLAAGFSGVLAIVHARGKMNLDWGMVYGLGVLTLAAFSIAINIFFTRFFRPTNQLGTATLSLVVASITLIPFVTLSELSKPMTWQVVSACIALGIISTAVGWISMLGLARRASAAFMSTVNYLIPIVGLLIGAIFLHEAIFWTDALALALIIGGTTMVKEGVARPETATQAS